MVGASNSAVVAGYHTGSLLDNSLCYSARLQHINVDHSLVYGDVERGAVELSHCPTAGGNVADYIVTEPRLWCTSAIVAGMSSCVIV